MPSLPEAILVKQFRVGVRSSPYLADHGFQDMVVLPGSVYVEMALCMERELCGRIPGVVRNVTFRNPVILSADDAVISVTLRHKGERSVQYAFHEAGAGLAAELEIARSARAPPRAARQPFSLEAFQARSQAVFESGPFYERLRENGNQYGPAFQKVFSIWRRGEECLGRLCMPRRHEQKEPHCVHPGLLDSVTQLLAPFVMEQGRTFVLRSIENIEVADFDLPDALWGHATLLPGSDGRENGLHGNVRVFDPSGKTYLELSGVAFSLLEKSAATKLVIAANFTADPLEDALNFWGDHLGARLELEFAPYDQVFQQLLDAASAFRRNTNGVNVVLLSLEEWGAGNRHALMDPDSERALQCFGARPRCALPNGLEIVHLNQYETDYLYREIFEEQCYLKHGIRLQDGDTVLDIGANIGLFSLFVMSRCADARIYAFEPAPAAYELLKANCEAYGAKALTFNLGVSNQPKTATFTYYEKSSVFSGFHSDESEDRRAIQSVVRNMLRSEVGADGDVEDCVAELTADRLRRRSHECRLTSVSDIIRDNRIERIHLLKIDAEKSELDIVRGIAEQDWPKIDQLVIEIHDRSGDAVRRIEALLGARGYRCVVEQKALLEDAGLFNLYATRHHSCAARHASLPRTVQEFCTALRAYADRSAAPLVLCVCPRSPGARSDVELDEAEAALLSEAGVITNVHTISSASLLERYPVGDYYDGQTHRAGHIPYTPQCYAAIGTALARSLFGLKTPPYKVIALDCDNTLWKGVCGEDGVAGIEVTPGHRMLQEFMLGQMNGGMLLCLCSKNNETDALEVFDRRTDMVLKREHLVSWRLNWNSKSANLRSLASELNLGLDSFILIDDNPVDCADVRINCPEVLTLQLPRNPESFASFLNHIWAFDRTGSTQEDRNRTRMYQQNRQREQYQAQSLSLKDFVEGLRLRVEIAAATPDQLGRISQLTFRTNQFNLTTRRRSEAEITEFLKREGANCLAVRVADRFGDYGLVGVLMYETASDRYRVDTLLLSCRVLGRGVEHALVGWLGERAIKEGKSFVELEYLPTDKNRPALEFIKSIGGTSSLFPAERLAGVAYDPDEKAPGAHDVPAPEKPALRQALAFGRADRSERLQRIADEFYDIERLAKAIEEYRLRNQPVHAAGDGPSASPLETALAGLWRKVLGRPRIGMNENFFEAGGTSLRAVQLVAMIRKELRRTVSLVSVFECPTVALLATKLSATSGEARGTAAAASAALRGQRRRYNAMPQHAS